MIDIAILFKYQSFWFNVKLNYTVSHICPSNLLIFAFLYFIGKYSKFSGKTLLFTDFKKAFSLVVHICNRNSLQK
jgi:hypothetical protein